MTGKWIEPDAIHRADRYAEFAAGAVGSDHRVAELRGADDCIHRANLDAARAADAGRLIDDGNSGGRRHWHALRATAA